MELQADWPDDSAGIRPAAGDSQPIIKRLQYGKIVIQLSAAVSRQTFKDLSILNESLIKVSPDDAPRFGGSSQTGWWGTLVGCTSGTMKWGSGSTSQSGPTRSPWFWLEPPSTTRWPGNACLKFTCFGCSSSDSHYTQSSHHMLKSNTRMNLTWRTGEFSSASVYIRVQECRLQWWKSRVS